MNVWKLLSNFFAPFVSAMIADFWKESNAWATTTVPNLRTMNWSRFICGAWKSSYLRAERSTTIPKKNCTITFQISQVTRRSVEDWTVWLGHSALWQKSSQNKRPKMQSKQIAMCWIPARSCLPKIPAAIARKSEKNFAISREILYGINGTTELSCMFLDCGRERNCLSHVRCSLL